MSVIPFAGRASPRQAAGFTVVEAIIGLVVGGLLASATLALVLGQSRYYERMGDQIWAEQTSRATSGLMVSELRQATARDLLAAESDSVSVRYDFGRAIACDSTGVDEATLLAYDSVAAWGLAADFRGTACLDPSTGHVEYADGFVPTAIETGEEPRAACTANGAPGTGVDSDYTTAVGWSAAFAGGVPDRGSLVRFYGRLTYRFAPSSFFEARTALWRGTQELTGPFADGAALRYVMADGSVRDRVDAPDFREVRAVRVRVTSVGPGADRYDTRRELQYDVPLGN